MLAQEWLSGDRAETPFDSTLERHLALPHKFDPKFPYAVLNNIAERIVYVDDVPSLLYQMYDNHQLTFEGVIGSAKLPYDCFWLEFPTILGLSPDPLDPVERAENGALVQKLSGDQVRMIMATGFRYNDRKYLSTITFVIEFDTWPPLMKREDGKFSIQFGVRWAFNKERIGKSERRAIEDLSNIIVELIFGIFLVTQPRTYSDEKIAWGDRKQRRREEAGKKPLLEYRKIKMQIGVPKTKYSHGVGPRNRPMI